MLAQRTQETYEELLNKPPRIDPDAEDGIVADDPTRKLPELAGGWSRILNISSVGSEVCLPVYVLCSPRIRMSYG